MTWLTSQSLWFLVPVCLGIALLVAAGSRLALLALVPAGAREGAHAVAAPLMPALGAAFAILAALTLSNEIGHLSSSETIVSSEAADGGRLAWAATMPGVRPAPIHSALRSYLLATRRNEWHGANAAAGTDPATEAAIAGLERAVRAAAVRSARRTSTSTELLASIDALTSDRRARLAAASRELPAFYVITVAISGIALIANASALTLRFRPRIAVLVGGLALVVGLSMALILALGTPARGPIVVSGSPIDALIRDLGTGYFHSQMRWLPEGFSHPARVELPTAHHLRPIREDDIALDYPAVMGSRERLWAKYGAAWRWPPESMTYEEDKRDLARHEREHVAQETFNYAIFDRDETALLGCVYIDPPDERSPAGSDALVTWWVVEEAVGSDLERTLAAFVPRWIKETWGFERAAYTP